MKHYLLGTLALIPGVMGAQSAIDAMRLAPSDIRGTARFTSMGGAFGALGGDLSVLSQNPGGIGIYRTNEIGFTVDLDSQRSQVSSQGEKFDEKQTKFLLNNIGGVFSIRTGNTMFPNFNIGFTFNKAASFNCKYQGEIGRLSNSMSNYVAGISNANHVEDYELEGSSGNLYSSNLPWMSILGCDSYLIFPTGAEGDPTHWIGQWTTGTTGRGILSVEESGSVDEYNVALGGNIANTVFWGMDFGITNLNFNMTGCWGEVLHNALIDERFVNGNENNNLVPGDADWRLWNRYHASGTGFNYKLGIIVKPIQEFRIGLAFHTPTWYSINETYSASLMSRYGREVQYTTDVTNSGVNGYNDYNYRTPWRFIASAAGVIGGQFIISADYEWATYSNMKFSEYNTGNNGYYDDYWDWDWYGSRSNAFAAPTRANYFDDPYYDANTDIKNYYRTASTIRIGAEYRVIPQFSIRAGFAYTDSPVKQKARDNQEIIYGAGTINNYTFDNSTTYVSCGVGYRYQKFYVDLAYQYRHRSSTYHAYSPDPAAPTIPSPEAKLSLDNNNVVLSMGFRF